MKTPKNLKRFIVTYYLRFVHFHVSCVICCVLKFFLQDYFVYFVVLQELILNWKLVIVRDAKLLFIFNHL